jgi:hypothetical protein
MFSSIEFHERSEWNESLQMIAEGVSEGLFHIPEDVSVNKWGMFCFDLVICFAIHKSYQEKMSCYVMFFMFLFCNSGQFSFFHVLLNTDEFHERVT